MAVILVASDAPSVRREVVAALEGPDTEVDQVPSGPAVLEAVRQDAYDLVVLDLQMGNMGGMATCLELRLEETYLDAAHMPVLMLLDRRPDVFLARRSGAEGWLVKPIEPLRLRRAAATLLGGGTYHDLSYQPVPVLVGDPGALDPGTGG